MIEYFCGTFSMLVWQTYVHNFDTFLPKLLYIYRVVQKRFGLKRQIPQSKFWGFDS